MKRAALVLFIVASIVMCGAAFAGPGDNANEFIEKAVAEAEERSNPPVDQSAEGSPITWSGDTTNTTTSAGTGASGSAESDQ